MDPSINFIPKLFSKRLSRHSYISPINDKSVEKKNTVEEKVQECDDLGGRIAERCLYCQESDVDCLAKCASCGNVFCNSGIKDSSHIYVHSKFSSHKSFKLLNYEQAVDKMDGNEQAVDKMDGNEQAVDKMDEEVENCQKQIANIKLKNPFNETPIECAHCHNLNLYQLSFILVNNLTKELVNLKSDYSQVDSLSNTDKKLVFFCTGRNIVGTGISASKSQLCFSELQNSLFGGLDVEDDFIKPLMNRYDVSNKFGFKKFFINRLVLKDHSDKNTMLLYNQLSLCHIYTIESSRLKALRKEKLKKNDIYNFIDENNEYQFFDSEEEAEEEEEAKEEEEKEEKRLEPLHKTFTSPLLQQENQLIQTKTTALKKITKTQLNKTSVYESFKEFAAHNLNLLYHEQYAMLSLSSTSQKLSNNMVFVPYKKMSFEDEFCATLRLNTNYSLPVLKVGQILGLKHCKSGQIAFGAITQVPTNSFNPELRIKMLKFESSLFVPGLDNTNNHTIAARSITDYREYNVLPFDLVLSRVIGVIYGILAQELKLEDFLMNIILGKHFENFEFSLSSFKSKNLYNPNFNLSQRRAIDNLDSNKVVMVKGQVGTGKTLVSSAIIRNLIQKDMKPVLVCSGANSTVDNLCERFYADHVARNVEEEDDILISRLITPLKENLYNINHKIGHLCFHNFILSNAPEELINLSIKNKTNPNSLSPKNLSRLDKFYRDFFQQQDVVFTTCYNANDPKLKDVKFKSIIVDDCSTTMNLLTLIPLSKNCEKLVLIGDDKQLSPYIHDSSQLGNPLKQSLFQRVLRNRLVTPIVLTEQYRMGHRLGEFPNHFFYNNQMINGIVNESRRSNRISRLEPKFPWPNPKLPIMFWDQRANPNYKENEIKYHKKISNIENFFINQKTFQNYTEGKKIIQIIKTLHFENHVSFKDIGIITPYVGQRVLLTQMINDEFANYQENKKTKRQSVHRRNASMGSNFQLLSNHSNDFLFENHDPNEYELSVIDKAKGIEIGSVDSFQGKEKDFVIFSTVKSERIDPLNLEELKILDDYRRLNVGITRSKIGLVVIGHSQILSETSKYWGNYLSYLYEANSVVEGDELNHWKCNYSEYLTYLRG